MNEKLNSSSSPEAWGDGSLPRHGLKPTRTLSSEFRSVKCPNLKHQKWGSEGSAVCQNETQNDNITDIAMSDRWPKRRNSSNDSSCVRMSNSWTLPMDIRNCIQSNVIKCFES